jgi:hypothetical protein
VYLLQRPPYLFRIGQRYVLIKEVQCDRAVHRASIDITVSKHTGNLFGRCTFPTCGVSINGDNDLPQVHQQSFKGQGMGFPGFNRFFLLFCVEAQPSAIRIMMANKKMMMGLNLNVVMFDYR